MVIARRQGWQATEGSLYWFIDNDTKKLTRRIERPKRVEYTVIALDERGSYITERVWGDFIDIRADGFKRPQDAEEHGRQWFEDKRVHRLLVRMSVQERPGESWKAGPTYKYVERG
ncbi:hypothetical protein [Streptomyces sp. NPDC002619]|uniref:hypothetical protein n=1 Tax=Streptomyces sp. NPDC002619 TaxID=3364655 RepID=UPI0036944838